MSAVETKKTFTPRLYSRGVVLGFKRNQSRQYSHTVLVRLEGLRTKEETEFYLGKRVAYLTRAKGGNKQGPKSYQGRKVVWGKIVRSHGSSGALKAKFNTNLPATAIGGSIRVFLYPSRV